MEVRIKGALKAKIFPSKDIRLAAPISFAGKYLGFPNGYVFKNKKNMEVRA